jgi:hypothetical protein
MEEITCKRCGKCCFLTFGEKAVKCKHLVKLPSGKYFCRIYNKKNRLGTEIGKFNDLTYYCGFRKNAPYDYKDCPYNTNKEIKDIVDGKVIKCP